MKNKVLVAVTNCGAYANGTPTGLWLSELTHFWDVFEAEGFAMEIISPKGGKSPLEPKSLKGLAMDASARTRYEDRAFMAKLEKTIPADQVDWTDFAAIYYTGGHGVMYDFRGCEGFNKLNRDLFEHDRVVSSVCHGYCGIVATKLSDGSHLINNRAITGFSWFEERLAGVAAKVPYNVEEQARNNGAKYTKAFLPFMPYVITDGNLITGQNPASAKKTAFATLQAIQANSR